MSSAKEVEPSLNTLTVKQTSLASHIFQVLLILPFPSMLKISGYLYRHRGPGSSIGIVTGYGLDGLGIESRWEARFSAPVQTGPGAHPASCTMGTGSFPGVKSGRGVTLNSHPLPVPLVMKEYSYTSTPPMGRTACTQPQCLYKDDLYLY